MVNLSDLRRYCITALLSLAVFEPHFEQIQGRLVFQGLPFSTRLLPPEWSPQRGLASRLSHSTTVQPSPMLTVKSSRLTLTYRKKISFIRGIEEEVLQLFF
jgi:hypothetical protein